MQPLNNGLIVELIDKTETTTGAGIILKQDVESTPLAQGKVLHITLTEDCMVAPGDTVSFSKYKGVRFEEEGKTLVYLKHGDLLIKN